jgi:hypothetical protein
MITLSQDFTEEEKLYWKNIQEILHYRGVTKEYDRLLLIRLSKFIEDQMFNREYECFLFVEKISKKNNIDSADRAGIEIKKRLGNVNLKGISFLEYHESWMEASSLLVKDTINFLLKTASQDYCSYDLLTIILDDIYEELDKNRTKVENIPVVTKPEEAAEKTVSIKDEYNSNLTVTQIALLYIYRGIPITRPSSKDRTTQVKAEEYYHTSGDYLYNTFIKLDGNKAQRMTGKQPERLKKDIKAIYPFLNSNEVEKADNDLIYLDELIRKSKEEE